jgi:hypothetical protein
MRRPLSPSWPLLAVLLAACASSPEERPASDAARPTPPAMKSSLAVLLEHRDELALGEAQVAWLEKREQQLGEENAPLRKTLEEAFAHRGEGAARGGFGGGGMRGGGMRGGGMRGGMGGGGAHRGAMSEQRQRGRTALLEMQDNDTRAYTEAETQLTEAQKPRARELISQEREKLFQQHEAMRQRWEGSGS